MAEQDRKWLQLVLILLLMLLQTNGADEDVTARASSGASLLLPVSTKSFFSSYNTSRPVHPILTKRLTVVSTYSGTNSPPRTRSPLLKLRRTSRTTTTTTTPTSTEATTVTTTTTVETTTTTTFPTTTSQVVNTEVAKEEPQTSFLVLDPKSSLKSKASQYLKAQLERLRKQREQLQSVMMSDNVLKGQVIPKDEFEGAVAPVVTPEEVDEQDDIVYEDNEAPTTTPQVTVDKSFSETLNIIESTEPAMVSTTPEITTTVMPVTSTTTTTTTTFSTSTTTTTTTSTSTSESTTTPRPTTSSSMPEVSTNSIGDDTVLDFQDIEEPDSDGRPPPPLPVGNEDYPQDARWDPEHDKVLIIDSTEESIPFIQKKQDGVTRLRDDSGMMKVVVRPQKLTQDTMVYLRYKQVHKNPMVKLDENEMNSDDMDGEDSANPSPSVIAFPLKKQVHEISLENLPEGWYVVCAESVRDNQVLEKDCFTTTVLHASSEDQSFMNLGVAILIAVLCVSIILATLFGLQCYLHKRRRKAIDEDMRRRVELKAQQEREYLERVNAEFRDVYIDPNEPYQERCIM